MKNVLITGAGRGIGLALTKQFLQQGFAVLATYRELAMAKELVQLVEQYASLKIVTTDVTEQVKIQSLEAELKKGSAVDILINNSGIIGSKANTITKTTIEQTKSVFEVNTFGVMRVTNLVLPYLSSCATIVHISSDMGSIQQNQRGGHYDYRMSKAALNMFNKCLSIEFSQHTCLVLHPGWVQTDMGGLNAPLSVADSAKGLFKVIAESQPSQTGSFFDCKGDEIPW